MTQPPQRLSMDTFVALCDILGCTPNDLIEPQVVNQTVRKAAADGCATGTADQFRMGLGDAASRACSRSSRSSAHDVGDRATSFCSLPWAPRDGHNWPHHGPASPRVK
nr:helix-turn-helix transcriptional regulator [Micromonospora sp. NBC_00855]